MKTFVTSFIENANKTPDKPAVMDVHGAYTYSALNQRSQLLSDMIIARCLELGTDIKTLRSAGKNGARIAVLLPRTKDYLTAELAIGRLGCAVIPMDSEYPESRISNILTDSQSILCITTKELSCKITDTPTIFVEDIVIPDEDELTYLDLSDPDIEGLFLYTSGSTGKPKGVVHRQYIFNSIFDLLDGINLIDENDISCCMAGFTFVASIVDLITPLIAGGTIYIADETERVNIDKLYEVITKRQITGMYLPPQMFSVMRELHGALPLKYIIAGGEKLKVQCQEDGNVYEVYGSTEASSLLIHKVGYDDTRLLGKPGPSTKVYLIDDDGGLIDSPGAVGELCVESPFLALGYNNMPEETADKFVPCPFEAGKTMYHTGDYMEYDKNKNLLFHGRKDRMVKLRGYRVELAEIENVMLTADAVDEAAVVIVRVSGAEKICLYYTGKDSDDLKGHAAKSLPEYMIPDYFVRLDEMPRNDRNKIDYTTLKAAPPPVDEGDYNAPETELEERICDNFADVLELERVSATASFFDLGGTSLSVAVLINKLDELGEGLAFQDISNNPTPRALAAYLSTERASKIPAMDRDFYPLTKTQLGIYLEAMTGGSTETYTTSYLMRANESVTAEQIISAAKTVLAAHPSMKYIIRAGADAIPHMFMAPEEPVDIPIIDGTEDGRLDFMKNFVPVVPVTDGLLFRLAVYRTSERCYLALKSHLIFFDGTSISLFISELNRALTGKTLLTEDCTVQQMGMIEEEQIQSGSHESAKQYYEEMFKAVDDMPSLSGDLEGPLTPGVSENLRYDPGTLTTRRVKAFCDENRITESSFFMGAMSILLGKYLNSKHVSFSTVYNGRALAEANTTLGTLIKRIPVYGDLSKSIPTGEYLRTISRQVFSTMSNDIYSFDEVLKNFPVNEDVEFIYQGDLFTDKMGTDAGENLIEGDKWFMEHYHTGMVTGCMSIQFFATDGLYNITLEYRNERFSEEWVRNFAEDLFNIAEGLLTCENIGDISILNDEDRKTLEHFNDTKVDIGFTPVHEQISRHAAENPDKPAVTADGKTLTFKELDILSDTLAAALQAKGITHETFVGILFDREVWTYVAENAVLKAGGVFVPFIPEYPDERIDFCMKDGEIPVLLTTNELKSQRSTLSDEGYKMLTIEELFGVDSKNDISADKNQTAFTKIPIQETDAAYCIYTSGTTGRPKGVIIEHKNIANYVHRNEKSLEIMNYATPGRICLALASFSFDVSVVEEFVPLCNGNSVVIATEQEIHNPSDLAVLIKETKADGMTCTPTYLLNLLDIPETADAIKQITFFDIGAEAFPAQLYDRLRKLRDDSVILNVYGPTECTMGCSAEEMTSSKMVTVGPPIANTYFYVSDPFGNELPVGLKGELIICGDQVGRGYVNLPDKTSAAFFRHNGMRAYHSGDLAAWTPDGKIRIFGRVDNQIKLRGFRIELDEIEKVMSEYIGIKTCAATVRKSGGTDYLVGYYTAQSQISLDNLKSHMHSKLPEYMVPSVFVGMDSMPMTSSGKVDKKKLPTPDLTSLRAEYVAPETENEKKICFAFAHVLKIPEDKYGALDDFYELGGDSLKTMVVMAEISIDGLSAADIFRLRTPKAIAAFVEGCSGISIEEREDEARKMQLPPTPLQIEMIDNQLFKPGSTMWSTMHFLLRFELSIDAEKLCDAVNKAINNHPALSSAFFFNDDNDLVQQYMPGLLPEVKVKDISDKAAVMLPDVLVMPFDHILNTCLSRIGVYRTPSCVYLFMDIHHLIMDGPSLGVLLADVVNAYKGRELERDFYFAIRAEEAAKIADGSREQDKKWYNDYYKDEVWCKIVPPDHESDNIKETDMPHELSFGEDQLKAAEEYWNASHSVMAITVALVALSKLTGKKHVMTNWIYNNRLSPESQNCVGMLIKNLPAAARMEEYSSTRELLQSIKNQVTEGIAHSTYDHMADTYKSFLDDCMEVNLQMGFNGEEIDDLNPTPIELANDFIASGARLEIELIENELGDGAYDLELDFASGLYEKEHMEEFHMLLVKLLEDLVAQKEII